MLSRALLVLAFRARDCLAKAQVEVLWESPPVPSPLASLHLDVKPQAVQIFQSPCPHQNSISSLEPQPFDVGSTALQEVFCELICTCENHASSLPGVHPTKRLVPHQQPLIHLFVSLAARTSWSGINANTDSPNMHQGDTYGVPSKYWNGVLPSGRTVNLESTKPAYRTAGENC